MTHRSPGRGLRSLLALPWHSLLLIFGVMLIVAAGIDTSAPESLPARDAGVPAHAQRADDALIERFGPQETLLLGYRPHEVDLLSEGGLARIAALRDALAALPGVHHVATLLDVPLLFSPQIRPVDVGGELLRVADVGVDIDLARDELRTNPLYRQSLLAGDGRQAALRITLAQGAERGAVIAALQGALAPYALEAELFLAAPELAHAAAVRQQRADLPRLAIAALALVMLVAAVLLRGIAWGVVVPASAGANAVLVAGLLGWGGRGLDDAVLIGVVVAAISSGALALRLAVVCRSGTQAEPDARVMRALDDSMPVSGLAIAVAVSGFLALAAGSDARFADIGIIAAVGIVSGALIATMVTPPLLRIAIDPGSLLARRWRLPVGMLVLLLGVLGLGPAWFADGPLSRTGIDTEAEADLRHIADEFGGVEAMHVVLRDDSGRAGAGSSNPWFSAAGMQRVRRVHAYLQSLDGVSGVRSLALLQQTVAQLYGHDADDRELTALWHRLPRARRERLVGSCLSAVTPETLLTVGLSPRAGGAPSAGERAHGIREQLVHEFGFAPGQVEVHAGTDTSQPAMQRLVGVALALGLGVATAVFVLLSLFMLRRPARDLVLDAIAPLLAAIGVFATARAALLPATAAVVFALLVFELVVLAHPHGKLAQRSG